MLLHGIRSLPRRFRLLLGSFQQSDSLAFADALTQGQIQAVCDKYGLECDDDTIFTPAIVLWGFVSQVIHQGVHRSCLAAVARIGVLLVAAGRPRCAQNSGPYCRARSRLPLPVFKELAEGVATRCESQVLDAWLWKSRHVRLVDGTTLSMPDTRENQKAYPQQGGQKLGLGFPIARILVHLSLATGMVGGMAMASYKGKGTGEATLLRELLDDFDPHDIVLVDKLHCTYFLIALLKERAIDFVSQLHASRKADFEVRHGQRIAKGDYRITWDLPACPRWMDKETYQQMPKQLELRLIQVKVTERGFRAKSLNIVTTLTNARQYRREELSTLYRCRWNVELDIRSIKVTMGMDQLRCLTPEMVQKEAWACLLAYNLIRQKMLQSAFEENLVPRHLSFTNALQVVTAGWMVANLLDKTTQRELSIVELTSIASQTVGTRPGRVEPRAVKRRPKPVRLLTMTRDAARALLQQGIELYKKPK